MQPYYRSKDGTFSIYGEPWWSVQRSRRDDRQCRRGKHAASMWGYNNDHYIGLCSCGATQLEPHGPWVRERHPRYAHYWGHRLVCTAFWAVMWAWAGLASWSCFYLAGGGMLTYVAAFALSIGIGNTARLVYRHFNPW